MRKSVVSSISIKWERRAVTELASLPRGDQQRVFDAIGALRENPLKGKALSGRWKGFRRLRSGQYRVIYAFDGTELLVSILRVAHRREAYR
jgi:mRNA interferase RelE/StbE